MFHNDAYAGDMAIGQIRDTTTRHQVAVDYQAHVKEDKLEACMSPRRCHLGHYCTESLSRWQQNWNSVQQQIQQLLESLNNTIKLATQTKQH